MVTLSFTIFFGQKNLNRAHMLFQVLCGFEPVFYTTHPNEEPILSQRKDICKYAIVESALVIPSKFTYSMIKPAFGSCYGLIKYKWFSKLQFKSLRVKSNLFDEYYKDTCAISKSDMIAFLQENSVYSLKDGIGECETTVQIYVGEKENHSMKKSAKIIHEKLQGSFIQVLPNMYHGEFSINHADDYVRKLLKIVKQR